MKKLPPFAIVAVAIALSIGAGGNRAGSKESRKTDLVLTVNPTFAFAPARITLKAQLKGVSNDDAEFYCPTIEWDWGDGTVSESSSDCEPFQPNKTEIQRAFMTQHIYKTGGEFNVRLLLKRQNKVVAAAAATLNITSALGEDNDVIR